MARSCLCQRLLARAAADAAFRLLPDAARLLWFDILALATAAPIAGRLRFLHSVPASVARLVSRPETEVGTELRDLAALGLIELDADGVTIWLPGVRDGQARAEAARRNGQLGGARRKGETLEQRRERRQAEMMLALPGGRGGTEGTEAATDPATQLAEPPAAPVVESRREEDTSSSLSSPRDAREPDWVSLGRQVAELAGLDGARGGYDFRPVQAWLNAGHTRETILAAVRRRVEGAGYVARDVYSLKFFDRMVEREAARPRQRTGPVPVAVPERLTADDAARLAALEAMADRVQRGARFAA